MSTTDNIDIFTKRDKYVSSLSGWRGSIFVYENCIEINSERHPINSVKKVFISPSTIMARGYLQVLFQGDTHARSIGEAMNAENTVLLKAWGQNEDAKAIKDYIEELQSEDENIRKKRLKKILSKYNCKATTNSGAALTPDGIIYNVLDTISTYDKWSDNSTLFIKYADIELFELKGSLRQETSVKGGGINLGGAVLGGFLFGGYGALLGGQIGTDIYTHTSNVDDRFVYMRSPKLHHDIILAYGEDVDDFLIELRKTIPEKEYTQENGFVLSKRNKTIESVSDELRTLKSLLDDGIITQEEFNIKKNQLLGFK